MTHSWLTWGSVLFPHHSRKPLSFCFLIWTVTWSILVELQQMSQLNILLQWCLSLNNILFVKCVFGFLVEMDFHQFHNDNSWNHNQSSPLDFLLTECEKNRFWWTVGSVTWEESGFVLLSGPMFLHGPDAPPLPSWINNLQVYMSIGCCRLSSGSRCRLELCKDAMNERETARKLVD